jgi:hypothetical protein
MKAFIQEFGGPIYLTKHVKLHTHHMDEVDSDRRFRKAIDEEGKLFYVYLYEGCYRRIEWVDG